MHATLRTFHQLRKHMSDFILLSSSRLETHLKQMGCPVVGQSSGMLPTKLQTLVLHHFFDICVFSVHWKLPIKKKLTL